MYAEYGLVIAEFMKVSKDSVRVGTRNCEVFVEGYKILGPEFFQCDALELEPKLMGKLLHRDNVILQITEVCVVYLCKYYGIDLYFLLCFVSLGSSRYIKSPLYFGTKQNLILCNIRNKPMSLLIN